MCNRVYSSNFIYNFATYKIVKTQYFIHAHAFANCKHIAVT